MKAYYYRIHGDYQVVKAEQPLLKMPESMPLVGACAHKAGRAIFHSHPKVILSSDIAKWIEMLDIKGYNRRVLGLANAPIQPSGGIANAIKAILSRRRRKRKLAQVLPILPTRVLRLASAPIQPSWAKFARIQKFCFQLMPSTKMGTRVYHYSYEQASADPPVKQAAKFDLLCQSDTFRRWRKTEAAQALPLIFPRVLRSASAPIQAGWVEFALIHKLCFQVAPTNKRSSSIYSDSYEHASVGGSTHQTGGAKFGSLSEGDTFRRWPKTKAAYALPIISMRVLRSASAPIQAGWVEFAPIQKLCFQVAPPNISSSSIYADSYEPASLGGPTHRTGGAKFGSLSQSDTFRLLPKTKGVQAVKVIHTHMLRSVPIKRARQNLAHYAEAILCSGTVK